jgi:G3E family GTPase
VDDHISQFYALDSILTVVDAKHVLVHLDEVKPDGVEKLLQAISKRTRTKIGVKALNCRKN